MYAPSSLYDVRILYIWKPISYIWIPIQGSNPHKPVTKLGVVVTGADTRNNGHFSGPVFVERNPKVSDCFWELKNIQNKT